MKSFLRFATTATVLGVAGVVGGNLAPAQANEPVQQNSVQQNSVPQTSVDQLGSDIRRLTGRDAMSQVTAISQLSDVKPTDWAFTALQSLVERYNCIAGYPDRTYRGNQAMTRYEFAAGLNACLDKVNEIIASGLADKVSKDDLAAIQKLQEEFAAELATLRGRVDTLEGKVATLESQQFSTTTKLQGQAIFASASATSENVVFQSRVRLNLNTSFTGDDLLLTRLQAGSGGPLTPSASTGAFLSGLDFGGLGTGFTLDVLRYDFKIGKDFDISVGPAMHAYDHIDVNSYANNEAVDFTSTFFINNPLHILVSNGAGVYAKYTPNRGPFSIGVLYMASNASQTVAGGNPTGGLFGESNQLTAELAYVPTDKDGNIPFALRLQYTRGTTSLGANSNPAYPTPDPLGSGTFTSDAFGANIEWSFAKGAALFGRFGVGTVRDNVTAVSYSPVSWSAGFAFPNLFKKGALAGVGVGQPFTSTPGSTASQTNLEAFYNYPVSDNITITPNIQFVFNPGNIANTTTVFVGSLRTVFSF